jgi:hypothetical protein
VVREDHHAGLETGDVIRHVLRKGAWIGSPSASSAVSPPAASSP